MSITTILYSFLLQFITKCYQTMVMVNTFLNIFMQLYTFSLSENGSNNGLMRNRLKKSTQHKADLLWSFWLVTSLLSCGTTVHLVSFTSLPEMYVLLLPLLSSCHHTQHSLVICKKNIFSAFCCRKKSLSWRCQNVLTCQDKSLWRPNFVWTSTTT